jgi:hypothetical protein
MFNLGATTSLIPDMAYIVIKLVEYPNGFAKQDAVLKAKLQLGVNRKLTEEEKTGLAGLVKDRFPMMELSDIMYSINLAETMPHYSDGGTLPDGTLPDVVLPPLTPGGDVFVPNDLKVGTIGLAQVAVVGMGLLLALRLFK